MDRYSNATVLYFNELGCADLYFNLEMVKMPESLEYIGRNLFFLLMVKICHYSRYSNEYLMAKISEVFWFKAKNYSKRVS